MHLGLLSLAHHCPVSVQSACEWSRSFNFDIRRAFLYMQWRLSWKQTLVEKSNSFKTVNHSPLAMPGSISTKLFFPWKHCTSEHLHPLCLQSCKLIVASAVCDHRVSTDCVATNPGDMPPMHQPWAARLQPTLLDQLADNNTHNHTSTLGNSIHQLLSQMHGLYPLPPLPAAASAAAARYGE